MLKTLDIEGFRRVAADYGAREIGHLSGLAYMADRTEENTTSRCIHPQIDDAQEVLNERFPPISTRSGTRTTESDEESTKLDRASRVLGLLAQLVEQRTFNPTVQGSNP